MSPRSDTQEESHLPVVIRCFLNNLLMLLLELLLPLALPLLLMSITHSSFICAELFFL